MLPTARGKHLRPTAKMALTPQQGEMINRTYLYVPANRPEMLARAAERGADAIVIDLEDSVPLPEKSAARTSGAAAIAAIVSTSRCEPWVRVNVGPTMSTDLEAVVRSGLAGVMVPKASPGDVAYVDQLLTAYEAQQGLEPHSVGVIPLIESAAGVLDARAIAAASPRVRRLGLGEADLAGDLGADFGHAARQIIRVLVVLASGAAAIEPPIGPTSLELVDMGSVTETTVELRSLGFFGRTAVHPRQIAPINAVFTPSSVEVESARHIVASLERATENGTSAAQGENGSFIDPAVARRAQATLDLAARTIAGDR